MRLTFRWLSVAFFFLIFCLLGSRVQAEETLKIKSVHRVPQKPCLLDEHSDLIGTRYNTKFFLEEEGDPGQVFVVKTENPSLEPYIVYLFFKTSSQAELQQKTVSIDKPVKAKQTVRIELSRDELTKIGKPDFWWVEVRRLSDEKVLAAKGLKGFETVSQRLIFISEAGKE